MDMWRAVFFGLLVVAVWGGVHVYLGRHLAFTLSRHSNAERVGWILVALHALLAPLVMLIRRGMPQGSVYHVLNIVAYIGMGFVSLLLVVFVIRDLSAWLTRRWVHQKLDEERRGFMTASFNVAAFATTGIATGVGLHNAVRVPDVKEVDVPIAGLHQDLDGLRIVQLSDLHIGPTLRDAWLSEVVASVNTLDADLIAITGDLVDAHVVDMGQEVLSLGNLKSRFGIYFVTGNHDYYWNALEWLSYIADLKVHALINAHKALKVGGATLLLGGVTDYKTGRMVPGHLTDPIKAMDGAPVHDFSILLAHQPSSVYEAAKAGWKMQLSGHTHGGQFFPWNFVVGVVHEFYAGLERHKDMLIYVSRGTGFWGPPNRTAAPSEITLLTLRRV